jgi:hypothetical protein
MNITEVIPTELTGFCDVATGECIVAGTDTETPHGSAIEDTSQRPEVPDNRPAVEVSKPFVTTRPASK